MKSLISTLAIVATVATSAFACSDHPTTAQVGDTVSVEGVFVDLQTYWEGYGFVLVLKPEDIDVRYLCVVDIDKHPHFNGQRWPNRMNETVYKCNGKVTQSKTGVIKIEAEEVF